MESKECVLASLTALILSFSTRIPSQRLPPTHANFSWIARSLPLIGDERKSVIFAILDCKQYRIY